MRTARSSVHSLAGKSGGRILRWRRPCVPWPDLSVHRRARALLERGLGGAFLRRARLVGKWRLGTLARRGRFGLQGSMAGVGSPRGGGHRLAARPVQPRGRAAARRGVTGRALLLFSAGLLLGGWLWVLRDDRNGSSRPGGPGASVTRIEHQRRAQRRYSRLSSSTRSDNLPYGINRTMWSWCGKAQVPGAV